VLVDGQELVDLMIRHRVGVRVKDVYQVRKARTISLVEGGDAEHHAPPE
jgi:restriction endonuclease Mrr